MLRASIARLGMHGRGPSGSPGPAPVHAVATLSDVAMIDGATQAFVPVTLSHPVSGTDLVLTLSDGKTATVAVGQAAGESEPYTVTPGDEPFVVSIVSYTGGAFTSLDITDTCTVTPGQPVELVRVYKGSIVMATSGSFPKTDLLALAPDTDPSLLEIDCEAVGGGAGGPRYSNNFGGGNPGIVDVVTRTYAEMPEAVAFSIGAGAPAGQAGAGGATSITGICTAAGGAGGEGSGSGPRDRATGPGGGALVKGENGGASNNSIPHLRLAGGVQGNRDGLSATTSFQHGSGGAAGGTGLSGGAGGWPGGAGGWGDGSGRQGGPGGAGAARFHVYSLEVAA